MHYCYILLSSKFHIFYFGSTNNLKERFKLYNSGKVKSTRNHVPWKLAWHCVFSTEKEARDFERYLKTGSGKAFAYKRFVSVALKKDFLEGRKGSPKRKRRIPCPRTNLNILFMTSKEIRQKYLDFFKSKGHVIVPSASLIPENDPSTLFCGSGMQPMVPYLLGEDHPEGTRIVDSQKCIRTIDIDGVGDTTHLTFFEMIGNWSLGDYFKKEQILWIFEFWTKILGFDPTKIYISVFGGNEKYNLSKDEGAVATWKMVYKEVGIEAKVVEDSENYGMQDGRIFYYGNDNWWSRVGSPDNMPAGEPGGPDSEMFYDMGVEKKFHENSKHKDKPCHINCDCGRFIEIGNNVFMEYIKTKDGFESLPKKNIDFGGGLERIVMISQEKSNVYETDLFTNIINTIERLSGKKYDLEEDKVAMRIIADHLRAATFIIADDKGISPSNIDQGYIVRRLIRRAIRHGKKLGISEESWTKEIAKIVAHDYHEVYPELRKNVDFIIDAFKDEEEKFSKTLEKGEKMITGEIINGEQAFNLFQTFGYPVEMTEEITKEKNIKLSKNFKEEYKKAMSKHQDLSRTASAGKFKGGLADAGEETKKLHTTAHLLLAALRKVLGDHVLQKGSNITAERLRFDFSHPDKLTDEQKEEVEKLVNEAIKKDLPICCDEMTLDEAKKQNAMGVFESKYGSRVKVYTAGKEDYIFSKEICGGPHVDRTGILGKFKIKKEQSSSAGVRRIKAVLE